MFTKNIINEIGKKIHNEAHIISERYSYRFASAGDVKWNKLEATFKIGVNIILSQTTFNEFLIPLRKIAKDITFIRARITRRKKGLYKYSLTIKYESTDKNGHTLKEINFNRFAGTDKYKDIKKDWLHKTFQLQGRQYRVNGLYPSRRKYSISIYDLESQSERIATINFVVNGFKSSVI